MNTEKTWGPLVLLTSVELLIFLEVSILNVALPAIGAGLLLGAAALAWTVNGYQLSFGGLQLAAGRWVDVAGARRLFVAGVVAFGVGSAVAGAASGAGALIAGRVVQGCGAALLIPAEMALLRRVYPGEDEYRRAISVWSTMAAVGAALGSALGGGLTEWVGWRWVFWINLPILAVALLAAPRLLPADRPWPGLRCVIRRSNLLAMGSATVGCGSVVLLASAALEGNWSLGMLSTGALALAALAYRHSNRAASDPLVPATVLGDPSVRYGLVASALVGVTHVPAFVVLAFLLQEALGYSPAQVGLAMVPIAVTNALVARGLLQRMLRRHGPHVTFCAGMVAVSASMLWLAFAVRPGDTGYVADVLAPSLCFGIGLPALFAGATMPALRARSQTEQGTVSGLLNTSQRLAAAIGVTLALSGVGLLSARGGGSGWQDAAAGDLRLVLGAVAVVGFLGAAWSVGHVGRRPPVSPTRAEGSATEGSGLR